MADGSSENAKPTTPPPEDFRPAEPDKSIGHGSMEVMHAFEVIVNHFAGYRGNEWAEVLGLLNTAVVGKSFCEGSPFLDVSGRLRELADKKVRPRTESEAPELSARNCGMRIG